MSDPIQMAKTIIDDFRIILMKSDSECGNEILCTHIAKECTHTMVDNILKYQFRYVNQNDLFDFYMYWNEVKVAIDNE
jgi:hypothetical protein